MPPVWALVASVLVVWGLEIKCVKILRHTPSRCITRIIHYRAMFSSLPRLGL